MLISLEQVAKNLFITIPEVICLLRNGILPGTLVAGDWQIKTETFEEWFKGKERGRNTMPVLGLEQLVIESAVAWSKTVWGRKFVVTDVDFKGWAGGQGASGLGTLLRYFVEILDPADEITQIPTLCVTGTVSGWFIHCTENQTHLFTFVSTRQQQEVVNAVKLWYQKEGKNCSEINKIYSPCLSETGETIWHADCQVESFTKQILQVFLTDPIRVSHLIFEVGPRLETPFITTGFSQNP